jgi:hypothetical protein
MGDDRDVPDVLFPHMSALHLHSEKKKPGLKNRVSDCLFTRKNRGRQLVFA